MISEGMARVRPDALVTRGLRERERCHVVLECDWAVGDACLDAAHVCDLHRTPLIVVVDHNIASGTVLDTLALVLPCEEGIRTGAPLSDGVCKGRGLESFCTHNRSNEHPQSAAAAPGSPGSCARSTRRPTV